MKVDLHTHTTFSDGTKTNVELLKLAKDKNIDVISITDHDICIQVEENKALAKELGITYIPGIELSTLEQNKSVHILGYFTDDSYQSDEMKEYYHFIKNSREQRTHKFIQNLKEYFNIEITYQDVFKLSNGIIARPHIAKAIHNKYPEYSFNDIFDRFIGDGSKAYVPSSKLSVQDGLELLKRNNCITVLAHPVLLKKHIKDDVMALDYDGLEAYYFRNEKQDYEFYKSIAKTRSMVITGGSDYHGIENDSKHGTVGEFYFEEADDFLKLYKERCNEQR